MQIYQRFIINAAIRFATLLPIYQTVILRSRVRYKIVDNYNHLISNKDEWNSCFIKTPQNIDQSLPYGIWTHYLRPWVQIPHGPELFSGHISTTSSVMFITARTASIFVNKRNVKICKYTSGWTGLLRAHGMMAHNPWWLSQWKLLNFIIRWSSF